MDGGVTMQAEAPDAPDHRAALAALPARLRGRLTERSDAAGLRHLALHMGVIFAMGGAIGAQLPGWWVLLFPQGVALAFLFTLQHETTHGTPFATARLNEIVGHGAGTILLQPFLWFRAFHLAHHRHTQDPERDPELAGLPKPDDWRSLARHLSCVGYWRAKAEVLVGNAFGRIEADYIAPRQVRRLRREARAMLAVHAAAALFTVLVSQVLLWVWLVPLALGFPVLRLYLLAEHGRCPMVANMLENTRTTYTNRLVRLLAWNMPYHAEHHAFPQVPFHKLPALNAHLAPHLRVTAPGYAAFARDHVADFGDRRRDAPEGTPSPDLDGPNRSDPQAPAFGAADIRAPGGARAQLSGSGTDGR